MKSLLTCSGLIVALTLSLTACGGDDDDDKKSSTGGTGGASGGSGGSTGGSGGSTGGSGGSTGGSGGSTGGAAGSAGAGGSAGGSSMSFFVSSTPVSGTGDLGGLAGADAHCKALATAAGSTKTKWVAYLSAGGTGSAPTHAKDRIGTGPWYNAKGEVFSTNLTTLHPTVDPTQDRAGYIAVKPADALFMDETGATVPSAEHDILTGTAADGTLLVGKTCDDWTTAATTSVAQVGHSDTPGNTQFSPSWNSAHEAQDCSKDGLIARGGSGRIYCFAAD